ncbi:uncharacterized protein MONOS_10031 [Monocercomonoides exilis]|uniref:uncharacterized protein n=1 Tax=Monocercomonoides exilis TaxID=2049356 RepID=UPI003559DBB1|nr:hypothetical protein MONOS_10031 [Monocercomonoides exilis]|eukprot:MONOS_10031.1-p1 / transcript=MONOS_10031.1 / gene=MONOS_10031 / organism=Monocercomonoides_exilis_PA203 / gene_product=unspecified product / transcript_product=unspecified product / location=Mono_scaffold00438:23824-24770(+) / protein_length=300 / sequence_SO=supercontig / SO=protein_coding / is_pseudo=false
MKTEKNDKSDNFHSPEELVKEINKYINEQKITEQTPGQASVIDAPFMEDLSSDDIVQFVSFYSEKLKRSSKQTDIATLHDQLEHGSIIMEDEDDEVEEDEHEQTTFYEGVESDDDFEEEIDCFVEEPMTTQQPLANSKVKSSPHSSLLEQKTQNDFKATNQPLSCVQLFPSHSSLLSPSAFLPPSLFPLNSFPIPSPVIPPSQLLTQIQPAILEQNMPASQLETSKTDDKCSQKRSWNRVKTSFPTVFSAPSSNSKMQAQSMRFESGFSREEIFPRFTDKKKRNRTAERKIKKLVESFG